MIRWVAPLLLLVAVVAGAWSWQVLNAPITIVQVTGDLNDHERQAIRRAVSASLDRGLLGVRLAVVKDSIRRLSWPREVTVRRLWPAGLAIDVEKERAVARWGAGGYLSTQGAVIPGSASQDEAAQLPLLSSEVASPREAMEVYRVLSDVLAVHGEPIAVLRESELGEWQVQLQGGLSVALGRERLAERMQRFALVYARVLADRLDAVGYVDARYSNGVAVRWDPPLVAYKE